MAITYESQYKHWQPEQVKIVDNKAVKFRDVLVHEIRMGVVVDPDLFIASPIWDWQQTDAGKFVMEHAVEQPYWISVVDPSNYGHVYRIMARLSEPDQLFWTLKWSKK